MVLGGLNIPIWYDSTLNILALFDQLGDGDIPYFLQIFPFAGTPLNNLSAAACAEAGAASLAKGSRQLKTR